MKKSTLKEIEERFDTDVARFSNLETGQATTLDALYTMELITDAIQACYPNLHNVLDIGCGAGNYTVKLLHKVSDIAVTLVDLSQPMLDRAYERVSALTQREVKTRKGDFQTLDYEGEQYDVILATAVLHHLRDDQDWEDAFAKLFHLLAPGGSIWIFDLVWQEASRLQKFIYTHKYGNYLSSLKDEHYRDHVFAYIEKEDSPRSLLYQVELMKKVGFTEVDVLHKNLSFASFVGFKP